MEVQLQENLAVVTPSPGSRLDRAQMAAAIRGAGFRPGKVTVEATGEGKRVAAGWEFRLPGTETPYLTAKDAALSEGPVKIRATIDESGIATVEMRGP